MISSVFDAPFANNSLPLPGGTPLRGTKDLAKAEQVGSYWRRQGGMNETAAAGGRQLQHRLQKCIGHKMFRVAKIVGAENSKQTEGPGIGELSWNYK